jgi:hypothetical protein
MSTSPGSFGSGAFGSGPFGGLAGAGVMPPSSYYLQLLTSEYKGTNAPNLQAWLTVLIQPFIDAGALASVMYNYFDVNAAVGVQLDILGQIVGVGRILPFNPTQVNTTLSTPITTINSPTVFQTASIAGMSVEQSIEVGTGGDLESVVITEFLSGDPVAVFTKPHSFGEPITASVSAVLNDFNYRILIKAKIIQNQWNGQIGSLWTSWQQLFPGGVIYVIDNQNMTATIILSGSFSALIQDMILNGMIVPRPETVEYTHTFSTLPIFGADLNSPYIAGADLGHAS